MWLLGLFLLGFIPRLIIIATQAAGLQFWEYETLALNIVSGQGYVIQRFGHMAYAFGDGNLYSFLAASVYFLVGHQPIVLAVVQAALASLAAPVIFAIGVRALSWPIALTGAALAALHPGLLAYSTKLHPLGLDVLLMALTVLWVGRGAFGVRAGLGAGFALGMTLMSRPTFFLAGLVALIWRQRAALAQPLPLAGVVFVALLVASPWIVRNWSILGRPVFISTGLEDVWKGDNPIASGSSYLPSGQDVFSAASPELQARLQKADELGLNDIFGQEVAAFVSQHPSDFASLVARKFFYFWWFSPQAGLFYPSSWLTAYTWYAGVMLTFVLVGAIAIVRTGTPDERNLLGMLGAISLTLTVIHALAYVEGRHRWGIEPLLLLIAARGIFTTASAFVHVTGQARSASPPRFGAGSQ